MGLSPEHSSTPYISDELRAQITHDIYRILGDPDFTIPERQSAIRRTLRGFGVEPTNDDILAVMSGYYPAASAGTRMEATKEFNDASQVGWHQNE